MFGDIAMKSKGAGMCIYDAHTKSYSFSVCQWLTVRVFPCQYTGASEVKMYSHVFVNMASNMSTEGRNHKALEGSM
jgi:hypothetical protein